MNWRVGLFRFWVAASIAWALLIVWAFRQTGDSAPPAYVIVPPLIGAALLLAIVWIIYGLKVRR